jgi:hypothetical protein
LFSSAMLWPALLAFPIPGWEPLRRVPEAAAPDWERQEARAALVERYSPRQDLKAPEPANSDGSQWTATGGAPTGARVSRRSQFATPEAVALATTKNRRHVTASRRSRDGSIASANPRQRLSEEDRQQQKRRVIGATELLQRFQHCPIGVSLWLDQEYEGDLSSFVPSGQQGLPQCPAGFTEPQFFLDAKLAVSIKP